MEGPQGPEGWYSSAPLPGALGGPEEGRERGSTSGGFKTVCLEETGLCERRVWRRAAHPVADGSCSCRSSGAQASQPRRSWGSSLRAQHGPGGLAAVCVRACPLSGHCSRGAGWREKTVE